MMYRPHRVMQPLPKERARSLRIVGLVAFTGYVLAIVIANAAIALFGMVPVGFGFVAPAGVYVAGLVFSLRDALQETLGRGWVVAAIVIGAVIAAALGPHLALASGMAFLFSELADFGIYTPLRQRSRLSAVIASNTVGVAVDSALFLWLAFGSLQFLAGQIVGKLWMTALTVAIICAWRRLGRHSTAKVS